MAKTQRDQQAVDLHDATVRFHGRLVTALSDVRGYITATTRPLERPFLEGPLTALEKALERHRKLREREGEAARPRVAAQAAPGRPKTDSPATTHALAAALHTPLHAAAQRHAREWLVEELIRERRSRHDAKPRRRLTITKELLEARGARPAERTRCQRSLVERWGALTDRLYRAAKRADKTCQNSAD